MTRASLRDFVNAENKTSNDPSSKSNIRAPAVYSDSRVQCSQHTWGWQADDSTPLTLLTQGQTSEESGDKPKIHKCNNWVPAGLYLIENLPHISK